MLKRLLAPVFMILCLFSGPDALAQGKVGTVDFNRAMNEVEEGKKALSEMESHFAPRKAELEAKRAEIATLEDQLKRQSVVLSEQARKDMERKIEERKIEYQRMAMQAQDEAAQMFNQVNQDLKDKLQVELAKVAKKKGVDVVIEKTLVMYEVPGLDLTDDLIKSYNASAAAGK